MRHQRRTLAIVLLAATAAIAQAQEAAKTEPKTGKSCVAFMSYETTAIGQVRMNFRNICATPFQIRVEATGKTREKGIEPGSPDKPSKAFVTCKQDDRCEAAKWQF
jgi:hypothetical protein